MEITGLNSYNQVTESDQYDCYTLNSSLRLQWILTRVLSSILKVLHFFSEFSKKSPCVLSRSIGRLVYMPTSGMVYGMTKSTDVLKDAIRTFCRPPVSSNSRRNEVSHARPIIISSDHRSSEANFRPEFLFRFVSFRCSSQKARSPRLRNAVIGLRVFYYAAVNLYLA